MRRGEVSEVSLPHRWLDADDLELVSVDELAGYLAGIESEIDRLEQQRTLVLAEFDARGAHDTFGFASTVAYLKTTARMAGGRAQRLVKQARAARNHPATFTAWWCGHLSADQAQQLFDISTELPDKYPAAETVLVDVCGETPDDTRQVLDYWKHRADPAGVDLDLETQMQRRRFDLTTTPNGMVTGRFTMTTTAGLALRTAIDTLLPPPAIGDTRTATQRRHDALEDLAIGFLETTNPATTGGDKPHINIHLDLAALKGEPGGLHETTTGQVLAIETVRQLGCDASVTRIVFGPESEIIDVGRKTRIIPPALRRAITARDRHCQHPGCQRPAPWCDTHHIIHWANGGQTTPNNLTLLCRYHHTLRHQNDQDRDEIINGPQSTPNHADAGRRDT